MMKHLGCSVCSFGEINVGSHFMWDGELYQKVNSFCAELSSGDEEIKNVIRSRDGEDFSFFGEEQVIFVKFDTQAVGGVN